ncbi:ankyrin repeat domain-containing protein [Enterovibrio makurazakiensis]|uniref:ankyrin repeat domain-containing protein n=1 Tax=Enterovibrio makurazakiensis TaxID=2910232 RepID=UPI003D1EA5D6
MGFFSKFLRRELDNRNKFSLEKIILTTTQANLDDLKERVDEKNVNEKIIVDKKIRMECTPLEYAIKVENLESIKYLIELEPIFYHRVEINLDEICKDLKNIQVIKFLTEKGANFNTFKYSFGKQDIPTAVALNFNDCNTNNASIGFYQNILLNDNINFKVDFLQELDELGISCNPSDFFTPSEACIIGCNTIDVTRKILSDHGGDLRDLFSLAIKLQCCNEFAMTEMIKLFVDEKGIVLEEERSGKVTLFDEIYNFCKDKPEIMFEASKRLDSYEGCEEKIYSTLTEKQISMLKGLAPPPSDKKIFSAKNYSETSACLEMCQNLNRDVLDHLVFNDFRVKHKIDLIASFISLGGNINVLYTEAELSDGGDNANLLFSLIYSEMDRKLIQFVVEQGAEIECNGFSALLPAVNKFQLPLIRLLLDVGGNPNYQDIYGNAIIQAMYEWSFHDFTESERKTIMDLLLNAGLNLEESYSINGTNQTVLEYIIRRDNKLVIPIHLLEKNKNFIPQGKDLIHFLISKYVAISHKKKLIDHNPGYKYFFDKYNEEGSILDLFFIYDIKDGDVLIDYILECHPDVKLTYMQAFGFTPNERSMCFTTYMKLFERNQHLVNKTYKFPDNDREYSLLHYFISGVRFDRLYKNKRKGIDELIDTIDFYVSLGEDINYRGKVTIVNAGEGYSCDSSLLQNISFKMTSHLYVDLPLLECFYRNGFDVEKAGGGENETPLLELHRYNLGSYTDEQEMLLVEIFDFFWNKKPFDLETRSTPYDNFLLAYSKAGLSRVVEWLLMKGADIHAIGGFDNSPALHKAISNYPNIPPASRARTVEVLIKNGAKIEEYCNADHFTPLMSASHYGSKECVKTLLEAGANPNAFSNEGYTASTLASIGTASYDLKSRVESNQSNILRMLVKYGANINFPIIDENNLIHSFPPLHLSVLKQRKEIFETLILLGADLDLQENSIGSTPLMLAVEQSDIYFVNRILESQIDLTKINKYGENALYYSLFREDEELGLKLYKQLRKSGAKLVDIEKGRNLLLLAAFHLKSSFLEVLSEEIDINSTDDYGMTALIQSIVADEEYDCKRREACVKSIISLGGDTNAVDESGKTPLIWALERNLRNIVDILVLGGASTDLSLSLAKEYQREERIISALETKKRF